MEKQKAKPVVKKQPATRLSNASVNSKMSNSQVSNGSNKLSMSEWKKMQK